MSFSIESCTHDDFLAYLMIYAASADFTITEKEKAHIVSLLGQDEFDKINEIFSAQNDIDHIETLQGLFAKFKDQYESKEEVIAKMRQIFKLEHDDFNPLEQELILMLNKIL